MKDITNSFAATFTPKKALLIYSGGDRYDRDFYLESYDIDEFGRPINAHPLGAGECVALARVLDNCKDLRRGYLRSEGLLPKEVVYVDPSRDGFVLWYTKPLVANLFFKEDLRIPCGRASIPVLLWKADKRSLSIYGLRSATRPKTETPLYYAPFFNTDETGKVCMGDVKIAISTDCSLEGFIQQWQKYFFGSYFSHLLGGASPVQGNIVQLWQSLVNTDKRFPTGLLKKNGLTIEDIIQ